MPSTSGSKVVPIWPFLAPLSALVSVFKSVANFAVFGNTFSAQAVGRIIQNIKPDILDKETADQQF